MAIVYASLIALVGVCVSVSFGFFQWRRTQAATRQFEDKKIEWEREKLALTRQLDRERVAEAAKADRVRERRDLERTERDLRRNTRRESLTDNELAVQYRETLVVELRSLRFLDMTQPLDLEKIYVQVAIREESTRYVREQVVRQLAETESREHIIRPADHSVATVRPDEGLRRHGRIVVLGDPGSGKTTMLRHLALRAAQGQTSLPVYIELRRFVDTGLTDLVSYVVALLAENYRFPDASEYVEGRFAVGDAVLLLDGLDEVLGGASADEAAATYDRIVEEINRLAVRYPHLPMAVTCRRAGWRPTLTSFATLEAVDFNWDQIGTFIDNWFETRPTQGRQLRQALTGNVRLQTLAANPLVLSLIAIVFEHDAELPERRAQLYNRCADVMLREWDAHRRIRRFGRFSTEQKRDLLEEVAWHFHEAGRRYFPEDELLDVIGQYLQTVGREPVESKDILTEITTQYGLLKEQAHGWYGFLHLTMQEYFAAVSAAARAPERVDLVVRHRHDPWWEEVLVLLTGLLPDATGMLLGILGRPPRGRRRVKQQDDVFASDLLLAARCLIGAPRIQDPAVRADILGQVRSLILTSPFSFNRVRAAAVLAEIGTDESIATLRAIIADLALDENVRAAAARALCGLPDTRAELDVDRLLAEGPQRHGDSVIKAMLDGVAATRSPAKVDRLIDRLIDGTWSVVWSRLVTTIGSIGDETTVPALLKAFPLSGGLRGGVEEETLLDAIVNLNGKAAIPWLWETFLRGNETYSYTVGGVIAHLGRPDDVLALVQMLKGDHSPRLRMAAGTSLSRANHADLVGPALGCLADPELDWVAKWLVVAALDSCGTPFGELEKLYREPSLAKEVRVMVAAAMAAHGEASVLPNLREAIRDQVVPPVLRLSRGAETASLPGLCWERLCQVLRSWQDDSIVPTLVATVKDLLAQSETSPDWDALREVVHAAAKFEGSGIFEILAARRGGLTDWQYLDLLCTAVTTTTAPNLARMFRASIESDSTWWRWIMVPNALERVAKDKETVRNLWSLAGLRNPDAEMLPRVIHSICRQGRFRLFANGAIEDLPA